MDFNKLKPVIGHPSWKLMEDYLAEEKTRLVTQLCNCKEDQLKGIQGEIRTLESLLRLKSKL